MTETKFTHRPEIQELIPAFWTSYLQVPLYRSLVAMEVANVKLEPFLRKGQTVDYPYIDIPSARKYTPNEGFSDADGKTPTEEGYKGAFQLVTGDSDKVTVDECFGVPIYIDQVEELQNNYSLVNEIGERAGFRLRNEIDKMVLANTVKGTEFQFGDIDETSILRFLVAAKAKLAGDDVEDGDLIAIVDPIVAAYIELKFASSGFSVADATLRNGFAGTAAGFNIFVSNNLPDSEYGEGKVLYVGRRGMIALVMQTEPRMSITPTEDLIGIKMKPYTLFGTGVPTFDAKRFLAAHVAPKDLQTVDSE